jgi:hypothetical protein
VKKKCRMDRQKAERKLAYDSWFNNYTSYYGFGVSAVRVVPFERRVPALRTMARLRWNLRGGFSSIVPFA